MTFGALGVKISGSKRPLPFTPGRLLPDILTPSAFNAYDLIWN